MGAPSDLIAAPLLVAILVPVSRSAVTAVAEPHERPLSRLVKRFYFFNFHLPVLAGHGHVSEDLLAQRLPRFDFLPLDRDHLAEAGLTAIGPRRRDIFAVLTDVFHRCLFRRAIRRMRIDIRRRGRRRRSVGLSILLLHFFSFSLLCEVAQIRFHLLWVMCA